MHLYKYIISLMHTYCCVVHYEHNNNSCVINLMFWLEREWGIDEVQLKSFLFALCGLTFRQNQNIP